MHPIATTATAPRAFAAPTRSWRRWRLMSCSRNVRFFFIGSFSFVCPERVLPNIRIDLSIKRRHARKDVPAPAARPPPLRLGSGLYPAAAAAASQRRGCGSPWPSLAPSPGSASPAAGVAEDVPEQVAGPPAPQRLHANPSSVLRPPPIQPPPHLVLLPRCPCVRTPTRGR